ncbi:class I SAM-dependent methyltransferase [Microbacterium sp.]|uniref:class I SAM-dependent methyltransferase n=1 Tax=Microbacterium sp. TaxID=51671 RepID=UPI003A875281
MPDVTTAYSARAAEYIDLFGTTDAAHPDDLRCVVAWARSVTGRVLDAGCGPGQWTARLASLGVDVRGIDVVSGFIDHARSTSPGVPFRLGSIDAIDEADAALGGILSWFSTIHHDPARIHVPLAEFARTLRPGGGLLLGYFDSEAVEPFDHAVLQAFRRPATVLRRMLADAGFEVIETHRRATPGQRPVGAIVCRRDLGRAGVRPPG